MSKASLETEIRNQVLQTIIDAVNPISDILPVSASELALPVVDSEGNEKFAVIKVTIPRGERDGNGGYIPYDGYAAAEDWKLVLADRADKAAKRKEKAERETYQNEIKKQLALDREHELAKDKICESCGSVFHSEYKTQKYCCPTCSRREKRHRNSALGKPSNGYGNDRKRARKYGVEYEPGITLEKLMELLNINAKIY